ncbi:hypothetical protein Bxe_A0298 [Paraburkholderia xenovorans LB400]|uniref:Uncharacterized protein n=1 Tax=Paraburkholderia xenovorans (strain LB400) TaxID=266265 RepID=Q13TF4_PARXL|nr:hypothetical protein Bxe_A0298 [Paraburkholderia xenovorans LB400]
MSYDRCSPKIRFLVCERGPRQKPAVVASTGFKRKRKNVVDETKKSLHNLVSLLLMQRRRTKRYRWCELLRFSGGGLVVNADPIFKN